MIDAIISDDTRAVIFERGGGLAEEPGRDTPGSDLFRDDLTDILRSVIPRGEET